MPVQWRFSVVMVVVSVVSALVHPGVVVVIAMGVMMEVVVLGGGGTRTGTSTRTGTRTGTGGVVVVWR